MLKKWIKIPNDIIQWTKKWHFFHFLLVPPFLTAYVPVIFLYLFFLCLQIVNIFLGAPVEIFFTKEEAGPFLFYIDMMYSVTLLFSYYVAIFLQICFFIFKLIFHEPIQIQWKFILNNRSYNIVYILSILAFFIDLYQRCTY